MDIVTYTIRFVADKNQISLMTGCDPSFDPNDLTMTTCDHHDLKEEGVLLRGRGGSKIVIIPKKHKFRRKKIRQWRVATEEKFINYKKNKIKQLS